MTSYTSNHSDLFYRALAAFAMVAPISAVGATAFLPEGMDKAEFILSSFGAVLGVVATALVLRAAYTMGLSKAMKIAGSDRNDSVTA